MNQNRKRRNGGNARDGERRELNADKAGEGVQGGEMAAVERNERGWKNNNNAGAGSAISRSA